MFRIILGIGICVIVLGCAERREDTVTVAKAQVSEPTNAASAAVRVEDIEKMLDGFDRSRISRALEFNNVGSTARWNNPISEITYEMTPLDPFITESNLCRRYELNAQDKIQQSRKYLRRACRNAIGTWVES